MLSLLALLAAAPLELDMLVKDHVAGQLTRTEAAGEVTVVYAFKDNGRGPDLRETYAVDKAGLLVRHAIAGTTTFGSKVEERFERTAAGGKWTTLADQGESTAPGFYVPLTSTPEVIAAAARALLAAPSKTLPLLPGGEARIQKLRTEALPGKVSVSLYAIAGVDFSPLYVWLDDKDRSFFAQLSAGPFGLIRKGHVASAKRLGEAAKAADRALLVELAKKSRRRYDGPVAIVGARVFDSRQATLGPPSTVYLFRGAISAIYPADAPVAKDAHTIDGAGKTLVPGLIDAHGHEGPWGGPLHVAAGVTIVRDVGNDNDEFLELLGDVARGELLGPRYLGRAGFLEGLSEYAARGSGLAETMDDARRWVDWYAQHGYRQLKIYNSFKPEWVKEIVEYAHGRGLRVSGHVPAFTTARQMVLAGFDELQHINQIFLNFLAGPKDDSRTLLRFTLVGEKAHAVDLAGRDVEEFLALLKSKGVAVDPTLGTFEDMFRQAMGELSPAFGMLEPHLPVTLRRGLRQASMDATPEQREVYRRSYRRMLEMVAKMDRMGITILPGTDSIAGFGLHRELELYVEAGLTPSRVLQLATLDTARELGFTGFGAIEPGAPADLLLVDGDPTKDLSVLRKATLVSMGPDLFLPAELYAALGIKPFVPAAEIRAPAGK